jgi:transposase
MAKKENKTDVSNLDSADKTVVIHLLQEQNNLLKEKYSRLEKRFKALESKLAKNSSNSSKPPSSDGNNAKKKKSPKKTTSSKKKSGKKPGGQAGHKGNHLEMSAHPDEIVTLGVDACGNCCRDLKNIPPEIEKRQLFEIPEPKIQVIEYQSENKHCKKCDYMTSACFPDEITHKTQYGPRAKSFMVYMNQHQLIPFARASEFFEAIYHHKVSPGTIVNAVSVLATRLNQVENEIKQLLSQSSLVHCDETGVNISGKKQWLHTVGTKQLTHYGIHEKRGVKATQDIGILPEFKGTMVHDHWKSYFTYKDCRHALCNAHHLRELRFIYEHQHIKWANKISELLLEISGRKNHLIQSGQYFSKKEMTQYSDTYDEILRKASREQAKRGTIDSSNLRKRLINYKESVLLFMWDKDVPFTNNLSEQDIRMEKVKQKISGCFRSIVGGINSCTIRGTISTAKKNKKNVFDTLQTAFHKIISTDDLLLDS